MADYLNTETIKDLDTDQLLEIQARATQALSRMAEIGCIELWGEVAGVVAAVTLEWVGRQ